MAISAKVRAVAARPCQSADLAFNMPGVLALQNFDHNGRTGLCKIGGSVSAFDIDTTIYDHLGDTLPQSGNRPARARLEYDSQRIKTVLATHYLFALRNAPLAAELEQLIIRRENAFMDRFMHASTIKQIHQDVFPTVVTRLEELSSLSTQRKNQLDHAYSNHTTPDGTAAPVGVVKKVEQRSFSEPVAMKSHAASAETAGFVTSKGFDPQDAGKHVQTQQAEDTQSSPHKLNGNTWVPIDDEFQNQRSEADQVAFSHPPLDNKMTDSQLQLSVMLERMKQRLEGLRVTHLDRIIENELRAMDQEIRRIQLNFAHTFLHSPMNGVITAIYKDLGESVAAGEPVLRIENDTTVYLIGTIIAKGALSVGQQCTIFSDDFMESGQPFKSDAMTLGVSGELLAVRGHSRDNDEWEVLIEVANRRSDGSTIFPLHYEFDRSNARIEFA